MSRSREFIYIILYINLIILSLNYQKHICIIFINILSSPHMTQRMSSTTVKNFLGNLLGIYSFLFGSQALHEFLRTYWFPKLKIASTAAAEKNIFHCAPVELFTPFEKGNSSKDRYYPPTYDQDGFVHLTHDPALLLNVLNHFYSSRYTKIK